ncbi:CHAT domain-containing protein [Streptomyces sp. NPDC024017]|uniref:CHAT domain-containing protein n=1 Tax=Streptomyces sp. NPDC024017 TaxID=3154326 RepID=UPI0033C12096
MRLRAWGDPERRIEDSVTRYLSSGRAAEVAGPQLLRDADRLLAQAAEAPPRSPERERVLRLVGLLYLARELGLRQGAVLPEASHIAAALGLLHDTRPQLLPAPLWDLAVEFGADPATRAETAASFAQAEKDGGADPLAFLVALEHAVADLPPGHPRLCPYALLLAVHWLERAGTFEDAGDLDRAEQWGRATLALTATGDPTRVAALHALVATLTRQTARHDTAAHAGAAVRMCRKYLASVPPGQGEHLAVRFSLGTTLKVRHAHTRASRDLDEAVDVLRDAVADARRAGGPAPDQLRSFAATVYDRYVREHAQEDLDEALGAMKEAVSTAAARGGPAAASALRTELVALERENAAGRGLDVTRRPLRRPPTPHQRAMEGRELVDRSQTPEGGLLDLDQGIELLGGALRELPPDFPDRAPYAAYLGQALLNRYEAEQDAADLDAAEETVRHAVRLCPEGDDNQVPFRTLLAMIADARHQRLGTPETRDAAVQRWRDLLSRPLDLTGYRRRTLHRLGAHLVARHEDTGTLSDLDEGVDALRQALDAAGPADGEHGPVALDLAAALLRRQEHSGTARDLDEAHTCLTAALDRLPPDDPRHTRARDLLTTVTERRREVHTRHEEKAAPVLRSSTFVSGPADPPAVPADQAGGDPDELSSVVRHSNRVNTLLGHFRHTGDTEALTEAVDISRRLLAGMPDTHPYQALVHADLGAGLLLRFEHEGDPRDLDAAVDHLRRGAHGPDATVQQLRNQLNRQDLTVEELDRMTGGSLAGVLELTGGRGKELAHLAGALVRRFERDGAAGDLEEAVASARRAVETTPAESTVDLHDRQAMLGLVLLTRYRHTGHRTDLDQCVDSGRAVLALTDDIVGGPPGEHRRGALTALCNRLRMRYLLTDDADDLEESVAAGREAARLQPPGTSDEYLLTNLGLALWDRWARHGEAADLDEAIDLTGTVAHALHPSSPRRAHVLRTLARMLGDRSLAGPAAARPDDAARCLALSREAATRADTSPPAERLEAAVAWGDFAAARAADGDGDWAEAADAHAVAVDLLALLTWRGLSRGDRERRLAPYAHLATDAAACAILAGRPEQAVELLDQGRSVLWSQVLDTRTDLTALHTAHPDQAARLEELRAGLDDLPDGPTGPDDGTEHRRRLARAWDTLLDEIRRLPGFAHFLKPLPFADLSAATADGPMILVNVSRFRCDALVVTPGRVHLVPLPGLTAPAAQRRTRDYLAALERLDDPDTPTGPTQQAVLGTLEWLWDTVAAPVLDSDLARSWQGGRVWWCATGPLALLPLHAAGYHDPDDEREDDAVLARVVSSYMPTLRGLLRARRPAAPPDHVRRLLILALGAPPPYASHLAPLPGARQEAETLRRRFPERHTLRLDAAATAQQALHLLDGHTCVHFACHAGQNLADPSKGALYLHDRPLTVTDLTRLDLETPELAVLSGCQTAVGGTDLPDEAIHLAAALLLGNFRHVVSTLWPIGDDSARALTDEVYARLGDPGGRIHPSRTPQALHRAVLEARRRAPDAPLAWASHVHFGP